MKQSAECQPSLTCKIERPSGWSEVMSSLSRLKSVWLGVFEQLCDEKRSGGLAKEESESAVEDEERREKSGSGSECGCGSSVGWGDGQGSAWSCATGAAETQEEAKARYEGAGPPLPDQREVEGVLEGSAAAVMGEVRVGKEGEGGSS
ncbi:unnamed protein product [Pleuronectes platessa]|uniref:Uncharacterized protein n=1 Tax=Pleuronectes platessa TaxID=8262 RepID=A0A9N7W102_PLEPL|nr:unnamed protein product [Pleuronectes platessa]